MFNFFLHGTACLIHSHTNINLIIISISILYMLQRALLKMELLVLHRCPTAIYTLFFMCLPLNHIHGQFCDTHNLIVEVH